MRLKLDLLAFPETFFMLVSGTTLFQGMCGTLGPRFFQGEYTA